MVARFLLYIFFMLYTDKSSSSELDLFTPKTFDVSLFEIDKEKGLVNLTKIAKHFDKDIFDWKRLPATQRFLTAFKEKNPDRENLVVVNGGNKNGTWASKKLALKFAEWISVDFEIFANEVLDNHFNPKQPKALTTVDILELTQNEIKKLRGELEQAQPAIEFTEKVTKATNAVSVGEFAKTLNIGQNNMFLWLRQNKFLIDHGDQYNLPYQKYIDNGVFRVIEQTFQTDHGSRTSTKTLITGKGQVYLVDKYYAKEITTISYTKKNSEVIEKKVNYKFLHLEETGDLKEESMQERLRELIYQPKEEYKFKTGDKVRVTDSTHNKNKAAKAMIGKISTIVDAWDTCCIVSDPNDEFMTYQYFKPSDVEIIVESPKLKNNDKVTIKKTYPGGFITTFEAAIKQDKYCAENEFYYETMGDEIRLGSMDEEGIEIIEIK